MRRGFRESRSQEKGEEPNQAVRAVGDFQLREKFTSGARNDTREGKVRRPGPEMRERAALHVYEGGFARRMHNFEDQRLATGSDEVKVVIIFTRELMRRGLYAKELLGDGDSLRGRNRPSNACFRKHERNCNGGAEVRPTKMNCVSSPARKPV